LRGASSSQHLWIVLPPPEGSAVEGSGFGQRRPGGWRLLHLHPSMSAGFRIAATLPAPPVALAAFNNRLWLAFPTSADEPGAAEVWTVRVVYNETVGIWFNDPVDRLELLPGLPAASQLEGFSADAAGPLALLREPEGKREILRLRGQQWQVDDEPPPQPNRAAAGATGEVVAARLITVGHEGATLVLVEGDGPQHVWVKRPRETWTKMAGSLPGEAAGLTSSAGLAIAVVDIGQRLELFALRGAEPLTLGSMPRPDGAWCLLGVDAGLRLFSLDQASGALRLQAIDPRGPIEPVDLPLSTRLDDRARWMHVPILGFMALGASMLLLLIFSERIGAVVTLPGQRTPAALPPRALATLIDYVPAALAVWIITAGAPLDLLTLPIWTTPLERAAAPLAALALSVLVAGVCEAIWGRSLGKRLTGVSVVGAEGGHAAAWRCLWRSLLKFLVLCMPLLGVFHLLNPQMRGLPELLSGLTVVREAPVDSEGG